ncbi:hypothetical protein SAMD00019534_028500 [Acytostelium subglobosum LB1]|uniref:hypothetical protein n=1 Tax=Acytostelium subglobosum LB1 TaxID=1410327 RepID=UPI000645179C|nr:hypothetical protein SAMD00019534_028500 [Acytostelium subglobosum LB1]GAM19675.1 hypothetical protein SAMD00019534_028500 [Acytostelium subglobosum LB1]|eukprot:XP_012756437.1 hypothetical protein SAMD00019534_028500 [Acytostelium subglobosum LB1]
MSTGIISATSVSGDKPFQDVLVPVTVQSNGSLSTILENIPLNKTHRRRSANLSKDTLYCYKCKTRKTPEWRKGPDGPATLCNACGLSFAKKLKVEKHRLRNFAMLQKSQSSSAQQHPKTNFVNESITENNTMFTSMHIPSMSYLNSEGEFNQSYQVVDDTSYPNPLASTTLIHPPSSSSLSDTKQGQSATKKAKKKSSKTHTFHQYNHSNNNVNSANDTNSIDPFTSTPSRPSFKDPFNNPNRQPQHVPQYTPLNASDDYTQRRKLPSILLSPTLMSSNLNELVYASTEFANLNSSCSTSSDYDPRCAISQSVPNIIYHPDTTQTPSNKYHSNIVDLSGGGGNEVGYHYNSMPFSGGPINENEHHQSYISDQQQQNLPPMVHHDHLSYSDSNIHMVSKQGYNNISGDQDYSSHMHQQTNQMCELIDQSHHQPVDINTDYWVPSYHTSAPVLDHQQHHYQQQQQHQHQQQQLQHQQHQHFNQLAAYLPSFVVDSALDHYPTQSPIHVSPIMQGASM